MQKDNQNPASYIADNSQLDAFNDGVAEQQRVGEESAKKRDSELRQMEEHMDLVTRVMLHPETVDHNDPRMRALLDARASALSAALRAKK